MPDTEISEDRWSQIFTLLAAVILVDDEAQPREIDAFIKEADRLSTKLSPDAHITPEHIGAWLKARHKAIRTVIKGPSPETEFVKRLVALGRAPYRQEILTSMKAISQSNNDIRDDEFNIINMAAAYWDLPLVVKR